LGASVGFGAAGGVAKTVDGGSHPQLRAMFARFCSKRQAG
jgi:hypothetical protein